VKIFTKIFATIAAVSMIMSVNAVSALDGINFFGKKTETEEEIPRYDDVTPPRGDKSPCPKKESEAVNAGGASTQSWYCKHTTNGVRPPIPSEMSYIENYDGYFLGKDEQVIYLTFDAGYENGNIEKILNVLKEEDVPAAFFILENLVMRNTDLVKRMADEGHIVCNHTARHRDMTKVSTKDEFAAELESMASVYSERVGGELAMYYRPPEGKFNEQNLAWAKELGYKTIFWSYAYADWDNNKQMSADKAKEKLISGTHNGEVLLLHPTSATNAEILSDMIKQWRKMGYRFGTLDELTGAFSE